MDVDNEIYLDDQDDDSLESQLLGEDDGSDLESPSQRNGGDLNIALKQEREEKKALKEQLAQRDKELERRDALLSNLGQRREPEPKIDRDALRSALSDSLLERPDEVFAQRDQHLMAQMQRMNAPMYVKAAKSDVADDPEYGDLYKSRPAFKKTVDAYIQNTVATNGSVDQASLTETLAFLAEIANEGQGKTPGNKAAKDKLTSIVDKGRESTGRKSVNQILEEKSKLAGSKNKADRASYIQWADSTEGKQVLNKALQSGLL